MIHPCLTCLLALLLLAGGATAPVTATRDRLTRAQVGCEHPPFVTPARDARGWIRRSTTATTRFKQLSGWPRGRPGHQIDHIIPLKRGGPDCPCNMQWMPNAAKRIKDRYE